MKNSERFNRLLRREPCDRLMTYDVVDNAEVLKVFGGYKQGKTYEPAELAEINARAYKNIGLDITRGIYDPVNHWMGGKVANWIRFFGVKDDDWAVSQEGGTAWISKRPFHDLSGLERNMPSMPKKDEVEGWYQPYIREVSAIFDSYDRVFVGAVEGPITDAYTYTDMELFMYAVYDAPELVEQLLDCTGTFSRYIAEVFAENGSAPLQFMGEDIAGGTGAILRPDFVRHSGLPRWRWISKPIQDRGGFFLFHTDGRYGDFLPLVFDELGADGLNPIERNGCNDIFEIHRRYPQKLLFGNVCCEVTLPHGNVFDVEDETLELIERIGIDGGIFIGSSSEVHDLVPLKNIQVMYETVHQYGSFPIDVERIRRRRSEIRKNLSTRSNSV
ncbi:MAG TPA: uroporphyrinogen decarboxylase family protein [Spirochaetia bacterium]|nr:uroporphyrinogen decarboxylase family protein [Spirochaetia bacterium]